MIVWPLSIENRASVAHLWGRDIFSQHQGCTTCCILASGMWENGERMRKWRGNGEEMERECRNGVRFTLYISSFSLYFLSLYPFPISKIVTFCREMLNTPLLSQMSQKNLTYVLWENNSGSNSLRGSSASCASLVSIYVRIHGHGLFMCANIHICTTKALHMHTSAFGCTYLLSYIEIQRSIGYDFHSICTMWESAFHLYLLRLVCGLLVWHRECLLMSLISVLLCKNLNPLKGRF